MKNFLKHIDGYTLVEGLIMVFGMAWAYRFGTRDGSNALTEALMRAEEKGLDEMCLVTDSANNHYVLKAFKVDDTLRKGLAQK